MKVAVIGAGAAGMMAAVRAARGGAEVICFERNEKAGRKLYATGNGRCNFSNLSMEADDFRVEDWYYAENPAFLARAFAQFGAAQVCRFFQGCGMLFREKDGYLYPYSGQASTVVSVLEGELLRAGATLLTGVRVTSVDPEGARFRLRFEAGGNAERGSLRTHSVFDRVILACGGKAAPNLGSDGSGFALARRLGHHVNAVRPSLCGIKCRESCTRGTYWDKLAGVRARARLRVTAGGAADTGELQLTEYGISGIPAFQISHVVGELLARGMTPSVEIDFLPDFPRQELEEHLLGRFASSARAGGYRGCFGGMVHRKIVDCVVRQCGHAPEDAVGEEGIKQVLHKLKAFEVTPTGLNDFDQAQVTAGGVPLAEITDEFASRMTPGLFLCGEMLDVDGKCGGYNLQWAWTSGWIAGKACGTK